VGKVSILTQKQKIILTELAKQPQIVSNYYFTGGTVLAEYYLQHRLSEDLDFFREMKVDNDSASKFISSLAEKHKLLFSPVYIDPVQIFKLTFPDGEIVKVDFSYYPHLRLKKGEMKSGLIIDSILDIAVNKLTTIMQRHEVKDYVDLFFLLKKFTFWDLKEGARRKFRMDLEPFSVAGAYARVEDFENLPRMIRPLTLEQLKDFFRTEAVKLGRMAVEK